MPTIPVGVALLILGLGGLLLWSEPRKSLASYDIWTPEMMEFLGLALWFRARFGDPLKSWGERLSYDLGHDARHMTFEEFYEIFFDKLSIAAEKEERR